MAALLCGLYARGGAAWVLGFAALVPWLRTLDADTSFARTLLGAWAMSVAFTAAVFFWFGTALGAYTQIGATAGLALLLLAAPLFQPQILVFAAVRQLARRRHGAVLTALAGATAWVIKKADLRLTASVWSQISSVTSSGPRMGAIPALLTRMEMGPSFSRTPSTSAST